MVETVSCLKLIYKANYIAQFPPELSQVGERYNAKRTFYPQTFLFDFCGEIVPCTYYTTTTTGLVRRLIYPPTVHTPTMPLTEPCRDTAVYWKPLSPAWNSTARYSSSNTHGNGLVSDF